MLSAERRSELCSFAATWLAVGAFLLVLLAFDFREGSQPSSAWVVAGGVAFVLMIALTVTAVRAARAASSEKREPSRPDDASTAADRAE